MAKIACPGCGFSRELPDAQVPDGTVRVTCPRCGNKFAFSKTPAAAHSPIPPQKTPPSPQPKADLSEPPPASAASPVQPPSPVPPVTPQAGPAAQKPAAPVTPATPAGPASSPLTQEQFEKLKKIGTQTPVEHSIKTIHQLFADSWELYKSRLGVLIGLYLFIVVLVAVPLVLCLGLAFMMSPMMESPVIAIIGGGIGGLIAMAGAWWGAAALTSAVVDESRGFREALRDGWQMLLPYAWVMTLFSFFVAGGSMLFVVPGILFSVWFMFSQFIVMKEDERGMTALLKSRAYVKGRWFPVFGRVVLIALIAGLLSAIPFAGPVISIFAYPYLFVFLYVMYEDLRDVRPLTSFFCTAAEKRTVILVAAAGYVVMVLCAVYAVSTVIPKLSSLTPGKQTAIKARPPGSAAAPPPASTSTGEESAVRDVYGRYRTAMMHGDIAALKEFLSREKAKELDNPAAASMISMARQFMKPTDITAVHVSGETATVSLLSADKTESGSVTLIKEGGSWKVVRESIKVSMGSTPSPSAQPSSGTPATQESVKSSFDDDEPGVTGEAVIIRNGVTETFRIRTGFFSETRFKDPRRAVIEFQIPGDRMQNLRSIRMTLDASKQGIHAVDGKAMSDHSFRNGPAPDIGAGSPKGYVALLQYKADGGQIYMPKESCSIVIESPYRATENGLFSGNVSNCVVHSAGIDITISEIRFWMKGTPKR